MKISCNLSKKGDIDKLIGRLEDYKRDLLFKRDKFVRELIKVGINTAKENAGEYAGFIRFEKQIEDGNGLLIATDGKKLIREWKCYGGIRRAEVSPLLMAEFGSGWLAHVMSTQDYRSNDLNVGQGTFPNQTHAFDKEGWFWETPDGEKHHSYGEKPSYPLYSATLAMIYEVERIAKEVFSNG